MFNDNDNQEQQTNNATNNTTNIQPDKYKELHFLAKSIATTGAGTFFYGIAREQDLNLGKQAINSISDKAGFGEIFADKSQNNLQTAQLNDSQQTLITKESSNIQGGIVENHTTIKNGEKSINISWFDSRAQAQAKVDFEKIASDERLEREKQEAQERENIRQNELTKLKMQQNEKTAIRNTGIGLIAGAAVIEACIAYSKTVDADKQITQAEQRQANIDSSYQEINRICSESETNYTEYCNNNANITIAELECFKQEFEDHLAVFRELPSNNIRLPGVMRCSAKINNINARIAGITANLQREQNEQQQRAQETQDAATREQQRQQQINQQIRTFEERLAELVNADRSVNISTEFNTFKTNLDEFRQQNPTAVFSGLFNTNITRLQQMTSNHPRNTMSFS